jgi:hypothetical protein
MKLQKSAISSDKKLNEISPEYKTLTLEISRLQRKTLIDAYVKV